MMRDRFSMRRGATLAALLLAGTATSAHAQFSGDPGSGASDAPAASSAPASGAEADRKPKKRGERQ